MHRLFERFLDFFYPARCPVCDNVLPVGADRICAGCSARIEYVREPRCCRCGKPLEAEEGMFSVQPLCLDCQDKVERGDRLSGRCLLVYDSFMQDSMARFKYGGRREYASFYAAELYRVYGGWMRQVGADALIPVPIHKNRLRERGYDQADLIARKLGRLSGIPVEHGLIFRGRDTLPQKELSGHERRRNLEGAFCIKKSGKELNRVPGCVIIIDDIYTTGSTVEACESVLRQAGIKTVHFLCVCTGKGY